MSGKLSFEKMEYIHESLINGQRQQCIMLIDEYGLYNFWEDYKIYLNEIYTTKNDQHKYFTDMTISYFRIKNR